MNTSDDLVIGIDLGTTNTCVACFKNGQLRVLENSEGDYTTPSFVYYSEAEDAVVGKYAVNMAAKCPKHGIFEMKRFIGRKFGDPPVNKMIKFLPFEIKQRNDKPVVSFEKFQMWKSPHDLSATILKKIRTDASAKLEADVTKAVLTVPAHFNVSQRKATLKAAKAAGFTILKLLSEPTAAALNYLHEAPNAQTSNDEKLNEQYWLVYDLGGGTFDVAIVKSDRQQISVVCVDGDSYLGGHDFDTIVLQYFLKELRKEETKEETTSVDMRRLRNKSKEAKESLSTAGTQNASIIIEEFSGLSVVDIPLSRQTFDSMTHKLVEKSIQIVDRCMTKSGIRKEDIQQVILAGGSSRMKQVQSMLQSYFGGKSLNKTLHPDQCVALGAALQAAMLSKHPLQKIENFKITEVISSSLGVSDVANKMDFVIKKDTPIPTEGSIMHTTIKDKQSAIYFKVYEGESLDATQNLSLGTLTIANLTPGPPGKCKVKVIMNVDNNGILTVTAKEKHRDNSEGLEISLVQDNKLQVSNQVGNEKFEEFTQVKKYLVMYCEGVMDNLDSKNLITSHKSIFDKCQAYKSTIVNLDFKDSDTIFKLGNEILKLCKMVVSQNDFRNMPRSNPYVNELLKNSPAKNNVVDNSIKYGHCRVEDKKKLFNFK